MSRRASADNRGAEKARTRLSVLVGSQGELARRLHVDAGVVSRWLHSGSKPETKYRIAMVDLGLVDSLLDFDDTFPWPEDQKATGS